MSWGTANTSATIKPIPPPDEAAGEDRQEVLTEHDIVQPAVHRSVGILSGRRTERKLVTLRTREFRQSEGRGLPAWKRHVACREVERIGQPRLGFSAAQIDKPVAAIQMKGGSGAGAHVVSDVRLFERRKVEANPLPEQKTGQEQRRRHRRIAQDRNMRRPDNRLFSSPVRSHIIVLLSRRPCTAA